MNREKIMKQWDTWRTYIANGGTGSWPRDAFEALLDSFEEQSSQPDDDNTNTNKKAHNE